MWPMIIFGITVVLVWLGVWPGAWLGTNAWPGAGAWLGAGAWPGAGYAVGINVLTFVAQIFPGNDTAIGMALKLVKPRRIRSSMACWCPPRGRGPGHRACLVLPQIRQGINVGGHP